MKETLTSGSIIRPPVYGVPGRPLILTTDASPFGAGVVLSQCDENGERYVVWYESELFNDTQKRYSQIKRELYAVYKMVKKLRKYLHGVHFVLEVDAKSVIGMLSNLEMPNEVAARWVGYIKNFDFEAVHVAGKDNAFADALSRFQCFGEKENEEDSEDELGDMEVKAVRVEGAGSERGVPVRDDRGDHLGMDRAVQVIASRVRPSSPYSKIIMYLSMGVNLEEMAKKRAALEQAAKAYIIADDLLFFRTRNGLPKRVIEDESEQRRIMAAVHSSHPSTHRRVQGTLRVCADKFFWRGMGATAKEVVEE